MLFVFSLIQQVLNWGYSLKQGLTVFESLAWFLKSFQGTTLSKECLLFYNGCNRTRIYCGIMCRQSGHFATCSSSSTHSCSNALFRPWFNPTPPLPAYIYILPPLQSFVLLVCCVPFQRLFALAAEKCRRLLPSKCNIDSALFCPKNHSNF